MIYSKAFVSRYDTFSEGNARHDGYSLTIPQSRRLPTSEDSKVFICGTKATADGSGAHNITLGVGERRDGHL